MKLKTIFILFNVIVVTTFLVVFLMPLFFLGIEFTTIFWRGNWYLVVLFVLVLAVLNTYFGLNWSLFNALEREDWRQVASVMERRIRDRGRFSDSNIRLLVNAYVVSSQPDRIRDMEQYLRERKPAILRRHALRFGIPHLLSNDGAEIERYFREFRSGELPDRSSDGSRGDTLRRLFGGGAPQDARYWIEWCYAFGLMLQGRVEEGRAILRLIVDTSPRGVVHGVALYLMEPNREEDSDVEERRRAFVDKLPSATWQKTVERERSELHVLVLSKLLLDVEKWLYR